jgi:hypothetical protein
MFLRVERKEPTICIIHLFYDRSFYLSWAVVKCVLFTNILNMYQNQHKQINKFILSHFAYINFKLNMIHVISPDNTR